MQNQMFLTVLLLYMPSNVEGVEHAGNAQIHTQKLCGEYFNQIFAFSDAWQMPFNPHLSHFGLRAVHTYRRAPARCGGSHGTRGYRPPWRLYGTPRFG